MFPFVYGFEWSAGYLIFLGVFFTVAVVVGVTLAMALWRTGRDFRKGRADDVRWKAVFHDLPAEERVCRHAMTGELPGRACEEGFTCGRCEMHGKVAARFEHEPVAAEAAILGMPVPLDRYYHRGHTWVRPLEDGTVAVGLDEMGRRLIGPPDVLELPARGTALRENGPAFRMRKKGSEVQILSPLDATVVEAAEPGEDWLLKLKPERPGDFAHLLRGDEVRAWYGRELERLELALAGPGQAPALADGGVLMEDLSEACPRAKWDAVCGELFLDV